MKAFARLWLAVLLGALPLGAAWARTQPKTGPVVVELFTAQGCASCKQANRMVAKLADRPGVIALTWSVDYWDYLGWKDTFAQPDFTRRQVAYVHHLGPTDVYTPQVVVNGSGQVSGDDAPGVEAMIRAGGLPARDRPRIRFMRAGKIRVDCPRGGTCGGRGDIWLVRFNPKEQDVGVTAGDNRGATVVHRNVVRQVERLAAWTGHTVTLVPPAPTEEGLALAIIVQRPKGGPILAAAAARPQ